MDSPAPQEEILFDDAYLTSLLQAIAAAEKALDLEVYIFADDAVGQQVTRALCDAAARGVKVRVLVDGFGSMSWGGGITRQMEAAGVATRVFHPLPWKFSHWHRSTDKASFLFPKLMHLLFHINARNHAKVCIVDDSIVFVGSANLWIHLVDDDVAGKKWRETSVRLTGVDTHEVQYAFNKAFGGIRLHHRLRSRFRIIPHSPFRLNDAWRTRHRFQRDLLKRIAAARKRIWVTNAYFVPNTFLLDALIRASRHGLDVRVLLPAKSDVFVIPIASAAFYAILLNNGIAIYEYQPTFLHAKVLIIDDWYLIGSSNLNYRSFKHDLEVNVILQTEEAMNKVEMQFLRDLSHAKKLLKKDVRKQSLFKRFIAQCILLIKYWL